MVDRIKIGEETGDVPGALQNLANTYENELSIALRVMTNLIEPAMIITMAIGVGFLLFAMSFRHVRYYLEYCAMKVGRYLKRRLLLAPLDWGRAAFTLIELMVVMGIVAIIIAAGVPSFVRAMRKEGLRKAVSDMVEAAAMPVLEAIFEVFRRNWLSGRPTDKPLSGR